MSGPLILAYDGSPGADAAIRAAGALFPGRRAIVATVHPERADLEHSAAAARIALPDEAILKAIASLDRAHVERACATAAAGAELAARAGLDAAAEAVPGTGSPWHGICDAARRHDAEVIVCGSRGLGGASRAALGSTSSALLHHAHRPVLVVPEDAGALTGPVVIGYDGSATARAAVTFAARLAAEREVVVTNVWESEFRHTLGGRALRGAPVAAIRDIAHDLEEFYRSVATAAAKEGAGLAAHEGLRSRAEAFEAKGAAWRGLLAGAHAAGAALVIVGSRGRGGVASSLLGSVSSGLVHNADVPVLVVPG